MSAWSNQPTATLRVRKANSSDTFSFVGVNSSNSAGSPENFLSAVNNILNIAGMSAVLTDMTRTVKEEVINNG